MAVELSRDAQRWLGRLPEIVNILLVILIALSLARLFWLAWPADENELMPATTTRADAAAQDSAVDVDTIASAHLFGEQSVTDRAAEQREISQKRRRGQMVKEFNDVVFGEDYEVRSPLSRRPSRRDPARPQGALGRRPFGFRAKARRADPRRRRHHPPRRARRLLRVMRTGLKRRDSCGR